MISSCLHVLPPTSWPAAGVSSVSLTLGSYPEKTKTDNRNLNEKSLEMSQACELMCNHGMWKTEVREIIVSLRPVCVIWETPSQKEKEIIKNGKEDYKAHNKSLLST